MPNKKKDRRGLHVKGHAHARRGETNRDKRLHIRITAEELQDINDYVTNNYDGLTVTQYIRALIPQLQTDVSI